MKSTAGYLVAALILAVVGGGCLGMWWLEGRTAEAEQAFGTQAFERSERNLDEIETYLQYASRLPGVGSASLDALRARRAASRYWRGDFGAATPTEGNSADSENTALQLVAANALYRSAVGAVKDRDRAALLEVIDRGLAAYRGVLRGAVSNEDAAYNYEYLVRLRAQVEKSGRIPAPKAKSTVHGVPGGPPPAREAEPFEILIPQDKDDSEDPEAGQSEPLRRRG